MGLITRIGASDANSFVTLDQAEYILGTLPDALVSWNDLTNAEKEYRLTLAAKIIGTLPLRGRRVYANQSLAFPRTLLKLRTGTVTRNQYYTRMGDAIPYSQPDYQWQDEADCRRIPDEVKEAQCFIAYSVVHRALANRGEVTDAIGRTVSSVSLGGALSVSFGEGQTTKGSLLDLIMGSLNAPIYMKMQKWLSQVRGGPVRSLTDFDIWEPCETLPTTTTTTSSSTTSTSSTSTTTTTP